MSTDFNLKSLAALAPNKSQPILLKLSSDFSSLAMEVLDGIFFQQKAIVYSHLHYLPQRDLLDNLLQLLYQHLWLHLAFLCYRDGLLFSNLINQPLLASDFSSAASSPLSVFRELKRAGPHPGWGFDLRECCGWFVLLSRPLKTFSTSAIRLLCFLIIPVFTGVALLIPSRTILLHS